ncbi:hypothetical protein, partial [Amnibacterium endophyticum]
RSAFPAHPLAAVGVASPAAWATTDPVGLAVGLVALVAAARHRRTRGLAVAAALLLLASVWPAGADPVGLLDALLVAAALATGAAAQRAAVALLDPVFRRSLVGSGWLTGVAALLLVGVVVALTGLPRLEARPDREVAQVQRWLADGVPADRLVLVGLGTWPDLADAGGASVGWYAGRSGSVPSSAPWDRADYVVADRSLQGAGGAAEAALQRSSAVARYGTGPDALVVRAVQGGGTASPQPAPSRSPSPTAVPGPTPTAPTGAAERRAAAVRLDAGRQLAANPRITMSDRDRALLERGAVDARIALVLAQLAATDRITVASFGVQPGDDSGLRTSVVISEVDGRPVPEDLAATSDLVRTFSALRGDFAARTIDVTQDGVVAAFIPDPEWVPSS